MPPRYKKIKECRPLCEKYAKHVERTADDDDPKLPDEDSAERYTRDIRWFDHWLDEQGFECPTDVDTAAAAVLGGELADEFSGTTGLYRWDRIYAFYEWLVRREHAEKNPLEKWNAVKDSEFGLTKTTAQSKHIENDETYAISEEEIRMMEEKVGRPRVRNQCIIRMMWQTGMRRGEVSGLLRPDLNRDEREITIRAENAKNDEERVVPYQKSLDGLLSTWIDRGQRDNFNDDNLDWLFLGERGAQLSGEAINDVVRKAAINAGINRRIYADGNQGDDDDEDNRWLITSHNIRHGFGTFVVEQAIDRGEDPRIWELSKQMGHSSVDITEEIYIDRNPRAGLSHIKDNGPE